MSEPTYSFTLTETERAAFAKVLGGLVTKLLNAPVQIEEKPNGGTQQARAVLSPPSTPPAVAQSNPQAPIALRDRWARDRKGNTPSGPPKDAEPIIVRISQTVRADTDVPRLKVSWPRQEGQGYITATCWDEKLFPAIMQREALGQPTTLHVREVRGYLNVVGVRA